MGKRKKILTVLLGVVLCSTMINYMLTPAYATEIWNAEEPEGMEMTDMEKEQKVRLDTAIKTADKIANIHKNEKNSYWEKIAILFNVLFYKGKK